jgi:hypothetical protein
MLDMR